MIKRALQRRQIVVISPDCRQVRGSGSESFNASLFQVAVETHCGLTAVAIQHEGIPDLETRSAIDQVEGPGKLLAALVRGSRLRAVAAFQSPRFHGGNRKQLAEQLWHEVQSIEQQILSDAERPSQAKDTPATGCGN